MHFLEPLARQRSEGIEGVFPSLILARNGGKEALPVVKMVIQQFEELQAQISFQNPLWVSLTHLLLAEVQATTLRALKEGEPCFEMEIECTLFAKGGFSGSMRPLPKP